MSATLGWLSSIDGRIEKRMQDLAPSGPGFITAYDPERQMAEVQPAIKRASIDELGQRVERMLPVITNVPVEFIGTELFELIFDVNPGDKCWLKFSQQSLEDWLSDGQQAPARADRAFGISDAVATMGIRDFGHVRVPCPKGVLRLGAVDGPQILVDLNTMTLELRSPNAIVIYSQVSINLKAPRLHINDRLVDPVTQDDI